MTTRNNPDHLADIVWPGVSQEVGSSRDSGRTWRLLCEGSAADVYSRYNSNTSSPTTQDAEMVRKVMRVVPTYFKSLAGDRGEDMLTELRKAFSERFMLWKSLCHSNIVQLGPIEPNEFTLYQEYYLNGNLRKYIENGVSDDNCKYIIEDVLAGLIYLHGHDPPIAHGSVNPGKIFITPDGKAKLGEFGLARLVMPFPHLVPSISLDGIVRWMSPEYFTYKPRSKSKSKSRSSSESKLGANGAEPTTQLDVWSFGCTLYEVITGRLPYYKCKYDPHVIQKIIIGDLPGRPEPTSHTVGDTEDETSLRPGGSLIEIIWKLIEKCWLPVEQRPSVQELVTEMQLERSWSTPQAGNTGIPNPDETAPGISATPQTAPQSSSPLPSGAANRTITTQSLYFVLEETSRIAESSTTDAYNLTAMRPNSLTATEEGSPPDVPNTELSTPRTSPQLLPADTPPLASSPYPPASLAAATLSNWRELLPLFVRWQTPDRDSEYYNQLNTWCIRIGIPLIRFTTEPVIHSDERGRRIRVWQATPRFPGVYASPRPLSNEYTGYGRSLLDAQEKSRQRIMSRRQGSDITYVRWRFSSLNDGGYEAVPHEYGHPEPLKDPTVIGWGNSKREAEEDSSRKLLCSGRYCAR